MMKKLAFRNSGLVGPTTDMTESIIHRCGRKSATAPSCLSCHVIISSTVINRSCNNTAQHNTAQYSTTQHNTTQHTTQHNTQHNIQHIQHNTAQHSTIQHTQKQLTSQHITNNTTHNTQHTTQHSTTTHIPNMMFHHFLISRKRYMICCCPRPSLIFLLDVLDRAIPTHHQGLANIVFEFPTAD